eukprot:ctg_227.g132
MHTANLAFVSGLLQGQLCGGGSGRTASAEAVSGHRSLPLAARPLSAAPVGTFGGASSITLGTRRARLTFPTGALRLRQGVEGARSSSEWREGGDGSRFLVFHVVLLQRRFQYREQEDVEHVVVPVDPVDHPAGHRSALRIGAVAGRPTKASTGGPQAGALAAAAVAVSHHRARHQLSVVLDGGHLVHPHRQVGRAGGGRDRRRALPERVLLADGVPGHDPHHRRGGAIVCQRVDLHHVRLPQRHGQQLCVRGAQRDLQGEPGRHQEGPQPDRLQHLRPDHHHQLLHRAARRVVL